MQPAIHPSAEVWDVGLSADGCIAGYEPPPAWQTILKLTMLGPCYESVNFPAFWGGSARGREGPASPLALSLSLMPCQKKGFWKPCLLLCTTMSQPSRLNQQDLCHGMRESERGPASPLAWRRARAFGKGPPLACADPPATTVLNLRTTTSQKCEAAHI